MDRTGGCSSFSPQPYAPPRDQEARSIASATLGSAGLTKWCNEVEVADLIVSGFPVQIRRSQPFLRKDGARRIVQSHRRRILPSSASHGVSAHVDRPIPDASSLSGVSGTHLCTRGPTETHTLARNRLGCRNCRSCSRWLRTARPSQSQN